jgi:putative ATP-dependent endonuclease of OLD family
MVNINDFDVFKHGTGLQSNFVICLKILRMVQFMKSEGVKSGFIAIEEPENHIHPHLQRAFINSILEIKSYYSELNIQFIITTHSKEIIRYQYPESLAILRLNSKITSISQYSLDYYTEIARKAPEVLVETKKKIKEQKMLKIESQMKRTLKMIFYHYPEIFFAKSVIIVEGYTEEGAFPEFARKMGLNFDIRGVSCINGLGRNSLNQFRLLIEYINIPVVCVYDKDDGSFSPSGKKDTNFITKEKDFEWEIIKNLPASKIITILESNGNKSENDKLLNNLKGIESKIPRRCDFHGLVKFYEDNPTLNSQTEESFVNFLGDNKNTAFGYSIGEIIEEGEIPQVYKKAIKKVIKLTK